MKTFLETYLFLFTVLGFSQTSTISQSNTIGEVSYESKDHRSNVYEVVNDRKVLKSNQLQGVIISATDYYPYGSEIGKRTLSGVEVYKYGFQGQEKDEEVKGKGNSINYKYRMHDARVGRFFAVDPLSQKYPYNSNYAFSENTLVNAVELEGLELFTVHGTWQGGQGDSRNFNNQTMNELRLINGNSYVNMDFSWKYLSWLGNKRNPERSTAAILLATHVETTRKKLINDKKITKDEPITIAGYSHGGNVAIQAAKLIEKNTGIKVNIITIATPAYNDGSSEDPNENSSIKTHLHLYSEGDGVDAIALGNETYTNNKTVNTEIPARFIPHNGIMDTHTEIGDERTNRGIGRFLYWLRSKFVVTKIKPIETKIPVPIEIPPVRDETGGTGHVNPIKN